jgi:chemotaxis protein methyltransferase CheR
VLVGETYFFRHPEHFRFIASEGVATVLRGGRRRLRGLSAGCATGEEAYSLAACLMGSALGIPVEVVGTDIHDDSLAAARRATYGAWSRRDSGPNLFPLYLPAGDRQVTILDSVRAVTSFTQANLLAPLPEPLGRFDFILCRNVLTYFTAAARDTVVANLARILNPGGYLLLGAVEADRTPAGLVRVGAPELQIFRQPVPGELTTPPAAHPRRGMPRPLAPLPRRPLVSAPPPKPAPAPPSQPPARLHLEALERIEHGDVAGATALLEALVKQAPDYLPGLLELALLRERAGAREAAYPLMRAVHARAAQLPPDQLIDGPEALPARFYRASADAYLNLGAAE